MSSIAVEHNPDEERLTELGVRDWPIWEKEPSVFPWHYDEPETCYFLAGMIVVTPEQGEPVAVGKDDLVTFPAGMSCTWKVIEAVRKHYRFGG
jgi:uncharacterized cupin superfamily protein